MADQLHIEYMALSDLITRMDEANPKDHDLGALHTSMDKFGYVETPVLNETTGKIVAGHGRIETLMQKKQARMKAPERIEVRADDWYVPVLRGVAFKTDSEARAYLIASNRLTFLGGWNELALAEMLEGLRSEDESLMHAAGYTDEDLEGLLHGLSGDWSEAFDTLPDGEKTPFQQMTFTLHDQQAEIVQRAISKAQGLNPSSELNENRNGNALAFICEMFLNGNR